MLSYLASWMFFLTRALGMSQLLVTMQTKVLGVNWSMKHEKYRLRTSMNWEKNPLEMIVTIINI